MRLKYCVGLPVIVVIAFLGIGCNNSPTVPLPPPDMTIVSTTPVDTDGFVTVTGSEGAAEPESVVLLYNETSEYGVMEGAEPNGAFEARIEAVAGDTLELQYKVDTEISYAAYLSVTAAQ